MSKAGDLTPFLSGCLSPAEFGHFKVSQRKSFIAPRGGIKYGSPVSRSLKFPSPNVAQGTDENLHNRPNVISYIQDKSLVGLHETDINTLECADTEPDVKAKSIDQTTSDIQKKLSHEIKKNHHRAKTQ